MEISENLTCKVCTTSSFFPIYNKTLLKCDKCGFVTANMLIDSKKLRQIYTENYFFGEEYVNYINDKTAIQANYKRRLEKISRIINNEIIGDVLEIGCAYGFFGEILKNNKNDINYLGIDIVPEAIEYARINLGLNVICGNFLEFKQKQKFNHIFMWDVIEHLEHPELFIKKAYDELNNNGYLYITTGDIESLLSKIKKEKWRMIHPPSHLHYFSKRTISKLLTLNGLEIVSISYPLIFRSIKQIFYSLFILNKKSNKFTNWIYNFLPRKLNIPFNTFDIMFIIAQKF